MIRVEWFSIFSLFSKTGHYAADLFYLYETNSKKSVILAARAAKFSFLKNYGTLKMNIFFYKNLQVAFFYFKEQSPRINLKMYKLLFRPQNGQIGFWPGQVLNNLF